MYGTGFMLQIMRSVLFLLFLFCVSLWNKEWSYVILILTAAKYRSYLFDRDPDFAL